MDIILKYFPDLTTEQKSQFEALKPLFDDWNAKINVISRRDMDSFYERHVLHSLAIARVCNFKSKSRIMDLGTGGGFPGIPLAILFPQCHFLMVDSIRKKIGVVEEIIQQLNLKNAGTAWSRAEDIPGKFDTVVTRAVAKTDQLMDWVKGKTRHLVALKGGDLTEEIQALNFRGTITTHQLADQFEEEFFSTKVILELKW